MPVRAGSVLTRRCIANGTNYLRMWFVSHISGPDIKVQVNIFSREHNIDKLVLRANEFLECKLM